MGALQSQKCLQGRSSFVVLEFHPEWGVQDQTKTGEATVTDMKYTDSPAF